jgi:hypothetical protein
MCWVCHRLLTRGDSLRDCIDIVPGRKESKERRLTDVARPGAKKKSLVELFER